MLATYDLGAAASASPALDAVGRRAYVACLDGSVHCLTVRQPGEAAGQLALALAWRRTLSGPVFSDMAVRPDGALLVAAVDGTLSALSSAGASLNPSKCRPYLNFRCRSTQRPHSNSKLVDPVMLALP